jgi:SDR family mycofactocin-dependent oxidoreductase
MAGRVEGKVAFITGAAHGQGRSHALRLAEEGADIIAVDLCEDYDAVTYPMGTKAELEETVAMVEALDRRAIGMKGDVRDQKSIKDTMAVGIAELGHIDIVLANAGIAAYQPGPASNWATVCDVNLVGVMNTVHAALPHLTEGAAIVVTGSLAALMPGGIGGDAGGLAYSYSKRTLITYVNTLALGLAPYGIRLNGVHPTNCNTNLLNNDDIYHLMRPDLEDPTRDDALLGMAAMHPMGVPFIEPSDISEAILYLTSDAARYVTGQFISVTAGGHLKF